MGYFSSGTEGINYRENYCFNCKNWTIRDGEAEAGCPIWDMHLEDNYELCNVKDNYLDKLIPRTVRKVTVKGDNSPSKQVNVRCNDKCKMFLPI